MQSFINNFSSYFWLDTFFIRHVSSFPFVAISYALYLRIHPCSLHSSLTLYFAILQSLRRITSSKHILFISGDTCINFAAKRTFIGVVKLLLSIIGKALGQKCRYPKSSNKNYSA